MAYTMPRKEERKAKLTSELDRALKAVITLNPQKVILFGSMSRGDIGSASDIDLLIIWDTDMPFLERLGVFYDAIKPDVAMDILVYTPDEINQAIHTNSFIRHAIEEGVVLYER